MALTASAGSDSKRSIIIVIVALLHVGMYYVIESGLSQHIIALLAPPVKTKIIEEEIKPEDLPPPPPPPEIAEPPPFVPPPEVTVQIQTQTTAIQTVTTERPVAAPPVVAPPSAPVAATRAKVDMKKSRPSDDYYPAASNRADETGSVVVKCLVKPDGRCYDPAVTTSSGFARLDEAAMKYAKEGLRFTPGTNNGVADSTWFEFKVTFKQVRD